MLGKLTWEAVPLHEPIVVITLAAMVLGGLALLGAVTYFKLWGPLWRDWFTTVDHKKIGIMYVVVALVMLVRGFADALMMRAQLAAAGPGSDGFLPPEHYDQIFTAHGVIMIFFVATPFVVGLMNIIVPLQIGARDMAFPFLNAFSFWIFVVGAALMMISLGVGEFAMTGWVAYPPLSGIEFSPGVGVDYYIWALQASGIGTLLTGVNLFITILRMRAPGMTLMKMPVFTWTVLVTSVIIIAAFPILTVALGALTLDRYLDFNFYTNTLGGNPMMYVNLVWAWGHPEVYILVLPAFGIFSEVTATFARKKLFGYKSMVGATLAIGILSFIVWLHHFFTMGSGASVNAFFGIMTMIIAIPTGVKIFTWLFTMYGGRVEFSVPMLWTIAFLVTFTIGGMTGVLLAIPGADFLLHNSLFLVAHFHNTIIGGALFGYLAGFAYWFPKVFGFTLNERLGKWSFACWVIGFYLAFMPLYMLGFMGMTRRMNQYDNPAWTPYLIAAFIGALFVFAGIILMLVQIYVSVRDRKRNLDLTGDPWNARTLEWATPSPPPFYNFAVVPKADELDAFHEAKKRGLPPPPKKYAPIHMPKNHRCSADSQHLDPGVVLRPGLAHLVDGRGQLHRDDRDPDRAVLRRGRGLLRQFRRGGAHRSGQPGQVEGGTRMNLLTRPELASDTQAHEDHHEHDHGHEQGGMKVFGMWVYLMSDLVLFGSLFASYAVLSTAYAGGPTGKDLFSLPFVMAETFLLLVSSITYGQAVLAMHRLDKAAVLRWLGVTFVLGASFIGMEIYEFSHLIHEGAGPSTSAYLSAFFALVATHGLHVASGLIWMAVVMHQVYSRGLTPTNITRVSCLSLFWHFLDLVWICVFTFVYLIGAF